MIHSVTRPVIGPALSERRRSERHSAAFPVSVYLGRVRNGARPLSARAVDLSHEGILLDLPRDGLSCEKILVDFEVPPGVLTDSFVHRVILPARVVRSASTDAGRPGRTQVAVEFERGLQEELGRGVWRRCTILGLLVFAAAIFNILYLRRQTVDFFWHSIAISIYSIAVTAYIVSRFVISFCYRPPKDVGYRPSLSVVVACKNEEQVIGKVIDRLYESDYPPELLEVIAVDDGSTDSTGREMEAARERHPGLRIITFPRNLGKRHGMAAGARAATGEFLVYLDSDCFVERETLYRLAQGFADPEVAAVAAHGFVANAWVNFLTRMQTVQYYVAFRVMKAAESVFSSVTCCSGCLAAYRRSAVMEVLDEWLHQRFLGRPATFGDDRSLTNFMLRKHKVIYDSTSHVWTIVPENYRQFFRQQLRWKKSWLRETVRAASFMWRRPPVMVYSFFGGLVFPLMAPVILIRTFLYLPLTSGTFNLTYLWGVLLMSLLYSAFYLIHQRNRMWIYGIGLCFFYSLILTWQLPWAIVTSANNKWGTR